MDFITDRTQADVDRANELITRGFNNLTVEEKTEWQNGLKGSYNYKDLNRVEGNVAQIATLKSLSLVTKTDWTATDIPTAADMARYLNNIRACQQAIGVAVPLPTSMNRLTYRGANAIEEALRQMVTAVEIFKFAGEIYCGEES